MSKAKVLSMLAALAEQSGEKVSEFRLDFVGRRVMELGDVHVICDALGRLMESSRRFPTVGEIREAMGVADPSGRDAALMLTDRIVTALARYGEIMPADVNTSHAIELAVGPAAWEVVTRMGGWNGVLDRAGNTGAFKAQLRDSIESYLKCGIIRREDVPTTKLPSKSMALEAARDNPRQLASPYFQLPDPNKEEPPF